MALAAAHVTFGLYRHRKTRGLYLAIGRVTREYDHVPHVVYVGRSGWWARPVGEFFDGRFARVI